MKPTLWTTVPSAEEAAHRCPVACLFKNVPKRSSHGQPCPSTTSSVHNSEALKNRRKRNPRNPFFLLTCCPSPLLPAVSTHDQSSLSTHCQAPEWSPRSSPRAPHTSDSPLASLGWVAGSAMATPLQCSPMPQTSCLLALNPDLHLGSPCHCSSNAPVHPPLFTQTFEAGPCTPIPMMAVSTWHLRAGPDLFVRPFSPYWQAAAEHHHRLHSTLPIPLVRKSQSEHHQPTSTLPSQHLWSGSHGHAQWLPACVPSLCSLLCGRGSKQDASVGR